jgi:hypothetical protein
LHKFVVNYYNMPKQRKDPNCISATIKLCGEAMKIVHKEQSKAIENGEKISIETAIIRLLTNNCKI